MSLLLNLSVFPSSGVNLMMMSYPGVLKKKLLSTIMGVTMMTYLFDTAQMPIC